MQFPQAMCRLTGIADMQDFDAFEPVEDVQGNRRFAHDDTLIFAALCCQLLGCQPASPIIAVRTSESCDEYFRGLRHRCSPGSHEMRSKVSFKKWVEQLMHGS